MKTFIERLYCVENLLSFCKKLKKLNIKYVVNRELVYIDEIGLDKITCYDVAYESKEKIIF